MLQNLTAQVTLDGRKQTAATQLEILWEFAQILMAICMSRAGILITFRHSDTLPSISADRLVLLKYSSSGSPEWAKTIVNCQIGFGITTDRCGNLFVSGPVTPTTD
jgi:hypothetical protein